MPADAGCGRIFIDADLSKGVGVDGSEFGDADEKVVEKRRHLSGGFDRAAAVVIFQPEADDSSIAQMAVEFEGFQFQLSNLLYQRGLLVFRDDRVAIAKTMRF